ncbi:MAG TPA: Hsp70 family protein, partial [Mycobacterium sp.]|nr:Hsp70 family protein [Mycobacterium sp.]
MHNPLGLSIGTANFVAVRAGEPSVRRRSQLTLFPNAAPQLGAPGEHPGESGLLLAGFVERVGEHEPLIAADGSAHRPELLVVQALDVMVEIAGDAPQVAIGFPAQWAPAVQQMFQQALQSHASPAMYDASPYLVPDAVAALTALHAECDVASRGVVALLDFGGGGTSITLADAAAGFEPIAETRRYHRFSGSSIDQAILGYVLGIEQGSDAALAGTAMVGDLSRLTEGCRQAKEQLSTQTATELVVELPGYRTRIAITRSELEQMIRDPLDGVLAALQEMLQHNRVGWSDLAAVATVGGGAHIPLVTERLSARRRVPVVTSERPMLAAAVGATLCAQRAGYSKEATAPAMAMTAATAPAGAPAGASRFDDDPGSAAPTQLAWSQEEVRAGDEPLPFSGGHYDDGRDIRPPPRAPKPPARRPERDRRPARLSQLMIGVAALVAAIAVAVVAYTVMRTAGTSAPTQPASTETAPV